MRKLLAVILVLMFVGLTLTSCGNRSEKTYADAYELLNSGNYEKAAEKFNSLGAYEDASQMTMYAKAIGAAETLGFYEVAIDAFVDLGDFKDSKQMTNYYLGRFYEHKGDSADLETALDLELDLTIENYNEAITVYSELALFKDSMTRISECQTKITAVKQEQAAREAARMEIAYLEAMALEEAGKYKDALAAYQKLDGYKDSADKIIECNTAIMDGKYNDAIALMDAGKYTKAITAFEALDGYKDSADKIIECNTVIMDGKYNDAIALMDAGKYTDAITAFEALDGYKDSANKIKDCMDSKYNIAIALLNEGKYTEAYESLILLDGYKDSTVKANSIFDMYKMEKLKNAKVGDYVLFGAYEQDGNSYTQENIEWLVLEVDDDRVLVISKYSLACKTYNYRDGQVTWDSCSLRNWLNNDFVNVAFSDDEEAMIPTVTVLSTAQDGRSTQDRVFLLSSAEANKYFSSNSARKCKGTEYGTGNNKYFNNRWWLRDVEVSYNNRAFADVVSGDGSLGIGFKVTDKDVGVRPAMWIDLNS